VSEYSLVQRGVAAITSSDTSPKDITLSSAVKPGSTFRVTNIKERRRDVFVQQGSISITNGDAGPTKDSAALGTAVDTTAAYVIATIREKRTDNYYGATVKLQSSTVVRATFHQPASGDTIDIDFVVVEHKARRGATARLLDANTLRVEWDGTLAAGETIDVSWEVLDFESLGDDIKEILFRETILEGLIGGCMAMESVTYDDAGNRVTWIIRVFDTAVNLEDREVGIAEGDDLETGELARYKATKDIDNEENDVQGLQIVLLDKAENEDID